MASGMGTADDEMNRREELRQKRLERMSDKAQAVGGTSSDDQGEVSTADASADDMLTKYEQENEDVVMKTETKKLKSPRFGDAPAYNLTDLDLETLKEQAFSELSLGKAEKQAAGALVEYAGEGLTQGELSEKSGVSRTTISRTKRSLTTSTDPGEKKKEVLRYARENPDITIGAVATEFGMSYSNVKTILSQYRHERIECEVEIPDEQDETKDTAGDDDDWGEFNGKKVDEQNNESNESDAVQKDEGEEDTTYKYDPKQKSKKQTRGGQSLKTVRDQTHLISLIREFDRRIRALENSGVNVSVPNETKGRISSLESQLNGVQSVVDRIENQQSNLERFVENEMDTSSDLDSMEEDVEDLKEQLQYMTEEMDLEWENTELGQRVDRIESSLSSHKQAIENLRQKDSNGSTGFSTEEKREVIVALAKNGHGDLIDRVLDEF
jgi:transcriptional regulator with XRE-family HTH domain